MQVLIQVPEDKVQDMINVAYSFGFKREHPQRRWTGTEMREAIRFALHSIVQSKGINDAADARDTSEGHQVPGLRQSQD